MRTQSEIEILNLRQKYKEYLLFLRARPIIPLREYKKALRGFQICSALLLEIRKKSA